ncbi:unnamed protein product [Nesidiocoris tenuis]|uniref:Uncharacterized protein n=2 Tax=Nesidiocoris tenuis TaxID=355587 RepID=A0A6H5HGE1_9HEMI|nr:HCNGP-like protein [Nesidiocoris tenuis]CAB0015687.1 unnamed protein product [Nesidiocoris tenuis]
MAALASLTEMYTDSEGEDTAPGPLPTETSAPRRPTVTDSSESPASDLDESSPSSAKRPLMTSSLLSRSITATQVSNRSSTLVSYLNDTVISDDEGERDAVTQPEPMEEVTPEHESPKSPSAEDKPSSTNTMSTIELPPEPTGKCSNEMQQKITALTDKMKLKGHDMNQIIQERKAFRNPSIYEKLIQFCGINEFGTNYEPQIYDPFKWNKSSYYDELAKIQKLEVDKREKDRKEKTKVEVIVGTAKKATNGASALAAAEEERKRKSKWDQVGHHMSSGGSHLSGGHLSSGAPMRAPVPAVGLATLTSSSTGTKSTVISAFGSLPKKPKT